MSHTLFNASEAVITTIFPDSSTELPFKTLVRQQILADEEERHPEAHGVCYDL